MAQVIPSITSLPAEQKTGAALEDIQDRLPSICVDYLSHDWTEEDVWASWRNMTRHKHEIANGVRLENASWRTWNKQRNKLRTISPETLNWLKDSDVTWLYGPLHTAKVEPVPSLKEASTAARLGIDTDSGFKPGILKHRTLSELLSIPNQNLFDDESEDNLENDSAPHRAGLAHRAKSETNLHRSNSMPVRKRSPATSLTRNNKLQQSQSKERSPESQQSSSTNKRHISFNTFVEQVISLDEPVIAGRRDSDSDSDDVLEMRTTLSRFSSRSSSMSSAVTHTSITIAKIPPTMLKTMGSYANNPSLPRMVYVPPPEYRSPQNENPPATTAPYGAPAVPPALNVPGKNWRRDDDDYGLGFDYFGGPDLTGSSPRANPAYGRPPAVQQPPAQPKWRQAGTSVDSSTSPSTSSSSSSLNVNGVPSPQPGRSILKVRPAAAVSPSSPEPVSPPVLFNYNPSVATGIGGMYGSYEQAGLPIGSPPPGTTSTSDSQERGRSTSRGHGSSQYDRSGSRSASNSSSASMGSVSRSPVETHTASKTHRAATGQPQSQQQLLLDKVQEGAAWEPTANHQSQGEPMDVDHSPDSSSTPTPHSSPQIVFRPLKDTSPSSLPHTSTRQSSAATAAPAVKIDTATSANNNTPTPTRRFDSAAGAPPTGVITQSPVAITNAPASAEATLSQPVDDDDGSTLIGRATNIANTAKDLLGALWYGAQDEAGRPRAQQTPRRHQRGSSLG